MDAATHARSRLEDRDLHAGSFQMARSRKTGKAGPCDHNPDGFGTSHQPSTGLHDCCPFWRPGVFNGKARTPARSRARDVVLEQRGEATSGLSSSVVRCISAGAARRETENAGSIEGGATPSRRDAAPESADK